MPKHVILIFPFINERIKGLYYRFPKRERKKEKKKEIPHPYKPNRFIESKKFSTRQKKTLRIPTVDPTSHQLPIFMTIIDFYLLHVINIPRRLLPSNQNYSYLFW